MAIPIHRVALFVCGCLLVACDRPTNAGTGTFVTLTAGAPVVLRGGQVALRANVWRRQGSDSVELPNVTFAWSLTNNGLAALASTGRGTANITGINPGYDTVTVVAAGLESSAPATMIVRIANALTLDSLKPHRVRYGTLVRAYGVGLGEVSAMLLGGGVMLADTLLDQGDTNGVDQRSYWVLYGAGTGRALALSAHNGVYTRDTITVLAADIYDPNKDAPAMLNLDSVPYPSVPSLHFYNPGLAFEAQRNGANGRDWYRWQATDSTKPYTVIFQTQEGLAGTDSVTLVSQRVSGQHGMWSVGQTYGLAMADCKGYAFRPPITPVDGLTFPMKHLHGTSMDLSADFSATGGYTMTAEDGYAITDSAALPDRFESSSDCLYADENFLKPSTHIELTASTGFADSLTIDHPDEIDWLRFRVDGTAPQPVNVKIATATSGSVLHLYVLAVPGTSNGLTQLAADESGAATPSVTPLLAPGDYYMVIVDAAGATARYGVCAKIVAPGTTCAPPSMVQTAGQRARRRRGPATRR